MGAFYAIISYHLQGAPKSTRAHIIYIYILQVCIFKAFFNMNKLFHVIDANEGLEISYISPTVMK